MDRFPSITVLIPVRNGRRHLERSLPAVFAQQYPGRVAVLVVDNGSSDGGGDLARSMGARVLACPQPGVARARQAAWRAAKTPLVAYLDADCEPPKDWLARAASMFAGDATLGAVGVRLLDGPGTNLVEEHIARSRFLDTDFFWRPSWLHYPFVVTAGLVARRRALAAIGGFDTSFGRATGEDADLVWRLAKAGWRTRYARDIGIVHHHRSTLRAMLRQVYWYGWGSAELFARHRRLLGHWHYVDPAPYRRLGEALLRLAPALVRGRTRYERLQPTLQALDSVAFLAGKARGSIARGLLFA